MNINVEPAGRDHASAGGSFDTGLAIVKQVYGIEGPVPVPYDFVNRAGDTKKMSASKGTGISINEATDVLPPEIVRYFMLRYPPVKRLYFDELGVARLIDEFAAEKDKDIVEVSIDGLTPVVSGVPFTHLVASYQSALKDPEKTIEIIKRTESKFDEDTVKLELNYIDQWLKNWAPEDIKFDLREDLDASEFSDDEKQFLSELARKIEDAPEATDGEWFHKAIYAIKEEQGLEPNQIFPALYKALIAKQKGPRAGWFLSILPRDWLIARLKLEK